MCDQARCLDLEASVNLLIFFVKYRFFVFSFRAVAQPLEPVWWKSSLQARSLRPQRHSVFHVRDRARLQSFMSSPLFQTEDPEKSPTKILLSY